MTDEISRDEFGEVLDQYLLENNILLYEWAEKLGIHRDTLFKYRHGKRRIPGPILVACRLLSKGKLNFNMEKSK